jgi:hypothetical protein
MMKLNTGQIIGLIAIVIVAGGIGFMVGFRIRNSRVANRQFPVPQTAITQRMGNRGFYGRTGNGRNLTGQITNVNGDTVTVQLTNGASQVVKITSSSKISRSSTGTTQDLQNGKTIAVSGVLNSDGSINAQSVLVSPPSTP